MRVKYLMSPRAVLVRKLADSIEQSCAYVDLTSTEVRFFLESEGSVTQATYSNEWHISYLRIKKDDVVLFVRALALFGHRPQDETDIIEATKLFLSDANRQISDIVQLCETHHIPHSYDSISSYEQLFRIESDQKQPNSRKTHDESEA